jgi:hypothetical protein
VLAHQPCDPAPADADIMAFELARDPFGPVGRVGGVDLGDPCEQFRLVGPTLAAAGLRPDPGVVVAVVGHEDPA